MTNRAQELLMQALALPESDRVILAGQILKSVVGTDTPVPLNESQVREIVDECQRRLDAYRRGETGASPLSDVFPELSPDVVS